MPIEVGRAVYPINGPWNFHIGDSPTDPVTLLPLWAEQEYDDSNWETLDLTPKPGVVAPMLRQPGWNPGWTGRGHPGYTGWAWYRVRIVVAKGPDRRLAMEGPYQVDDAYQVFANGTLVGTFGRFRGPGRTPVMYNNFAPQMYQLPSLASAVGTQSLTLAFRVWMGYEGLLNFPEPGGLHFAPVIGDAEEIESRYALDWYITTHKILGGPLEVAALLLLSIVAASLVAFDRTDRVYLWLASVLLFSAISGISFLVSVCAPQILSGTDFFLSWLSLGLPLHMGGWSMVWWTWFRFRSPAWIPWGIGALTLMYMAAGAIAEGALWDTLSIPSPGLLAVIPNVIRVLFLALLVFIVSKGVREHGIEGWLVLPAVLLMAPMQFMLDIAHVHLPAFWSIFGVIFSTDNIANLLLSGVIALLLLRRLLLTIRRERRMALDVKQAQEVQQIILPKARVVFPGLIIESEYRPAREVGGDFFQIIRNQADGSVLIVAGDVAGKGLKAGMTVALLVGAIRSTVELNDDPEFVLRALNRRLLGRADAASTCLALRIEVGGGVTLANGGHPIPYLNGEPLEMEGAIPLGIVDGAEPSMLRFQLKDGEKLILMSDGIVEATDSAGHLFGFERVHDLLRSARSAAEVAAAALAFGQEDDITVISVTRTPLEPAMA